MSFCHPLINIFVSDALKEHGRRVSIGDRNIINLRFAEEQQELEALVERR